MVSANKKNAPSPIVIDVGCMTPMSFALNVRQDMFLHLILLAQFAKKTLNTRIVFS